MKNSKRLSRRIANYVLLPLVVIAILAVVFSGWPINHLGPPSISQGLLPAGEFGKTGKVSKEFSEVLSRVFPLGSSANVLRYKLRAQGFRRPFPHFSDECSKISCGYADTSDELEYSWGGIPCSQTLRVSWKEDARERIVGIRGLYFPSCM